MTIYSYMTDIGQSFWSSLAVSLLIGTLEWFTFLCYVRSCSHTFFWDKSRLFLHTLLLIFIEILGLRHYPVHLHTLLLLILSSAYICLLTGCSWFNGVLEGTYFCLILEMGKSACRDGLLAYVLAKLLHNTGNTLNMMLLTLYMLFLVVLCILFSRRRHRLLNLEITTLQAVGLLYPLFLYLTVRYVQYDLLETMTPRGWILFDLLNYAIAACALLNLSATESMLAAQAEHQELLKRQFLTEQKQLQYRQQMKATEDVNRRYHDLKHYLHGLDALLSDSRQDLMPQRAQMQQFLQSIHREIDPYTQICRTGSSVMDTLLSQYLQECKSKNICLLLHVDAHRIDFIQTMDLCSLLGNAMDNAIEAASTVPENHTQFPREITVNIGISDAFLLMRFHNYFIGRRKTDKTGFLTTKADAARHGYGLGSIEAITEKYGGSSSVDCKDNTFTLHILIPLPEDAA